MKISILQWNMWVDESVENIISELKSIDADIVCAQELIVRRGDDAINAPEQIAKELGMHVYYKTMEAPDELNDWAQANAVFSKFPIVAGQFGWIQTPHEEGPYSDQYRGYVEATVQLPNGAKLRAGSAHMSYTDRFEMTDYKLRETDMLIELAQSSSLPLVLGADCNAEPGSEVLNRITAVLSDAGPDASHPSWTTKPFDVNGFKADSLDWRIDYLFASKDLTVSGTRIEETDASDHLPIFTELEILKS